MHGHKLQINIDTTNSATQTPCNIEVAPSAKTESYRWNSDREKERERGRVDGER